MLLIANSLTPLVWVRAVRVVRGCSLFMQAAHPIPGTDSVYGTQKHLSAQRELGSCRSFAPVRDLINPKLDLE